MPAAATEPQALDIAAYEWRPACEIRIFSYFRGTHEITDVSDPCGKPAAYILFLHSLSDCNHTKTRYACADCIEDETLLERCDRCSAPAIMAKYTI